MFEREKGGTQPCGPRGGNRRPRSVSCWECTSEVLAGTEAAPRGHQPKGWEPGRPQSFKVVFLGGAPLSTGPAQA